MPQTAYAGKTKGQKLAKHSLTAQEIMAEIIQGREKNLHPSVLLQSAISKRSIPMPLDSVNVLFYLELNHLWLENLIEEGSRRNWNDYLFVITKYNKQNRESLENSPFRSSSDYFSQISTEKLISFLVLLEGRSFDTAWVGKNRKDLQLPGSKKTYLFDSELKYELIERALEDHTVLNRLYQDDTYEATIAKYNLLEAASLAKTSNTKMRIKLLSSLTDRDFSTFEQMLGYDAFVDRFFATVARLEKDSLLLNRILGRYVAKYPSKAVRYLKKIIAQADRPKIIGFSKVIFSVGEGHLPKLQARFLDTAPFFHAVEDIATKELKKTYGHIPNSLLPFLKIYRSKAPLVTRCSFVFTRR